MWKFLSEIILKYRLLIISILIISTVFMFQAAKEVKLSYMMPKLLPDNHEAIIDYEGFQDCDYCGETYREETMDVDGVGYITCGCEYNENEEVFEDEV